MLLRNGFILGCDDQHFYEGRHVLDDDGGFRALVKVSHYAGDRAVSIFGEFGPFATLESFHAELRGAQDSNGTLQLSGRVTGDPDRRLAVALTRLVPNPVPKHEIRVEFENFCGQDAFTPCGSMKLERIPTRRSD